MNLTEVLNCSTEAKTCGELGELGLVRAAWHSTFCQKLHPSQNDCCCLPVARELGEHHHHDPRSTT